MARTPEEELQERERALRAKIEALLPEIVKSCLGKDAVVILHQDLFALDYQQDEYVLLGMAIKYAGLYGKEVRIVGTNRQTRKAS